MYSIRPGSVFLQLNQQRQEHCCDGELRGAHFQQLLPGIIAGGGSLLQGPLHFELTWQAHSALAIVSARKSNVSVVAVAFGTGDAPETWEFLHSLLPEQPGLSICDAPTGMWMASVHLPALQTESSRQWLTYCKLERILCLSIARYQAQTN